MNKVQLRDGIALVVRKPSPNDAKYIIEYLNIVGGESNNLLFGEGEFNLTIDQEIKYIQDINQDANSIMLLGLINNKIISVAQLSTYNRKRIDHNSNLAISVKKDYWGIGVGSAIMDNLINFAKENGSIKNISLGVISSNHAAISLYEKYGFNKIGVHKNFFHINNRYYDEILMDLCI